MHPLLQRQSVAYMDSDMRGRVGVTDLLNKVAVFVL